ncbi:MAG: hypothetical protein BWY78_01299 [Alphaproteobacteria bacterium ADurb.Bin438]|nr:MAG: hypothetical protein BWY78_01299 [Alphaproteobacteria bacterium ADurb.Bin438]
MTGNTNYQKPNGLGVEGLNFPSLPSLENLGLDGGKSSATSSGTFDYGFSGGGEINIGSDSWKRSLIYGFCFLAGIWLWKR